MRHNSGSRRAAKGRPRTRLRTSAISERNGLPAILDETTARSRTVPLGFRLTCRIKPPNVRTSASTRYILRIYFLLPIIERDI